eukprot:scpid100045/ scgid24944/ 
MGRILLRTRLEHPKMLVWNPSTWPHLSLTGKKWTVSLTTTNLTSIHSGYSAEWICEYQRDRNHNGGYKGFSKYGAKHFPFCSPLISDVSLLSLAHFLFVNSFDSALH